ncbi:MAG TPA: sugar phosphate isomerase/epimerase [Vicinamibacterales bacterium]|nr:sugar phosphate isomerase/epimerase [Vicinamibacterales bacterium]
MTYTRREFTKLALTAAPAVGLLGEPVAGAWFGQNRPNSLFSGVQIGAITYSFRSLPDQSAEATLRYVIDSGISAIELMDGPAEAFAGRPSSGRGGGRGGRGVQLTPEQQAEQRAAQAAAQGALKAWRTSVSMDKYKALRKMYNDAGVSIYAVKILSPNMSDEEYEYVFNVAEALGCTHTTLELPNDEAQLKRIGDFAMKRKIYAAYHTHLQGSMTAFDQAFALSPGNMANVDLGHYVAAGNIGGTPIEFLEKHHARISSVHIKDRKSKANGGENVPWGTGDTPLKDILQTMKARAWKFPATVELEYRIPEGSDPVAETKKCVHYCADALK